MAAAAAVGGTDAKFLGLDSFFCKILNHFVSELICVPGIFLLPQKKDIKLDLGMDPRF